LADAFDPREHFLLRVRGDSMILDGINDGDLAVVRQTATAKNGDMVVASVDGPSRRRQLPIDDRNRPLLAPAVRGRHD